MTVTLQQYDQNLAQTVASEGGNAIFDRAEDGGRLRAIRSASGATVAWGPPATVDPADSGSEIHKAAQAVRVLTNTSARVSTITSDPRLSDQAKAEDVAKLWAEAASRADKLLEEAEGEAVRLAEHEAGFFAPPPAADHIAELRDGELRQWFRSLPPGDVPAMVNAMANGEQPALLVALMRSPTPLPHGVAQVLPDAWRAHLVRTKPDELRAIEARRERLDWLLTVVRQVASAIPRPQATAPIITRQAA